MITEKHFALSQSAFWQQLLPLAQTYIRECNVQAARFCEGLQSDLPPPARGLVNEVGFRLFGQAWASACSPRELTKEQVAQCVGEATQHVMNLRRFHRPALKTLDADSTIEAMLIADRLVLFFSKAATRQLILFPQFPGCGWLD